MDNTSNEDGIEHTGEQQVQQNISVDSSEALAGSTPNQPAHSTRGTSTDGILRQEPATPLASSHPEATGQPDVAAMTVEQEPPTVSMTPPAPQPVEPMSQADPPIAVTPLEEAPQPIPTSSPAIPPQTIEVPAAPSKSNKLLIIIAAASAVLLIGVGALLWMLLGGKNDASSTQENTTLRVEEPKLGLAVTVADGIVEHLVEGEWRVVDTSTDLKEGDTVRTGPESRTVLLLDDGSAIRLDADSSVQLADLTASKVEIKQLSGTVYSRVASNNDRRYTVVAPTARYEALGTAFVTISKENNSGVQVYHSTVKVDGSEQPVTEGKQYYDQNSDETLRGKLTDINIDALIDDPFINWNLSEDEKDAGLQDKLGILPQIKARAEAREQERQAAEAAARLQAEKEAAEKAAKEQEEKEKQAALNQKVTRGTMTLTSSENVLSWNYTGKAVHGYKVVYSRSTMTPVFGRDEAVYISDMNITSTELPKRLKRGRYYVRVCAYTANTEKDACVDYSSRVSVDIK